MRKLTSHGLALVILLFSLCSLTATAATSKKVGDNAAKPTAEAQDAADARFNELISTCSEVLTGNSIDRYAHLSQQWGLADLLNPDPEKNLAARAPTLIMNSDQKIWYAATFKQTRKIRDAAYRIESYTYYPVINEGVEQSDRAQIIGHYETIQRAMNVIRARAKGKKSGKMVGFIGPAGTGKTELLNLLAKVSARLAMTEEAYFRYTFEFTGLDAIPELRPMTYGGDEDGATPATKNVTLNRSPFTLLTPALQQRVLDIAGPKFRARMEMEPLPTRTPSRKTQKVIDAIITHYAKLDRLDKVTDRDYLRYLSRHVKIVRLTFDVSQPTTIIRYLGKNPDMNALFFTENMRLEQRYGPDDPRSYSYGLIPSNDGEGLYIDEFFRQGAEVRDSTLDLAQNGIAQSNGSPAEQLDITLMFATNDASIEDAKQNGGAAAHLDRTVRLPMRHAIEPWHVSKIAIQDIGTRYFKMAALNPVPKRGEDTDASSSQDASDAAPVLVPYDAQVVFPDMEDGSPVGPDGRYAIYYQPSAADSPILIAPRTLMMLGLTPVSTRLVTDQKQIEAVNKASPEFHSYRKFKQYFTDPASRLQVLMGQVHVNNTLLSELSKARSILKEGQSGIGAREVENWFSEALAWASKRNLALTPVILDEVFDRLVNGDGITTTAVERPKWKMLHQMVKEKFLLPGLTADVLNVLQGQGRVESIYDDIKREIIEISKDEDAQNVEGEGNQKSGIDRKRLQEIYEVYVEISGQQFNPGMLKNFHLSDQNISSGSREPQLLEAVRTWLARREIEQTSISEIMNYFEGRPTSEKARMRGQDAEAKLAQYGYDKYSFLQALRFVKETQFEVEKIRGAGK